MDGIPSRMNLLNKKIHHISFKKSFRLRLVLWSEFFTWYLPFPDKVLYEFFRIVFRWTKSLLHTFINVYTDKLVLLTFLCWLIISWLIISLSAGETVQEEARWSQPWKRVQALSPKVGQTLLFFRFSFSGSEQCFYIKSVKGCIYYGMNVTKY